MMRPNRPPVAVVLALALALGGAAHAALITASVPTGGTGPGGLESTEVASSLLYWLKADAGVVQSGGAVSAWTDLSSRGNNFTQAAAAKQPLLVTSGAGTLNGQPVVRFDGNMTGNTGGVAPNADEVILGTSTTPRTFFAVNTLASGNVNLAGIWGQNDGDNGIRRASSSTWQNPGNPNDFTNPGGSGMWINGAIAGINPTVAEGVPHILSAERGTAQTWAATSLGDYFRVGTNTPRPYKGDIAEVVAYDRVLNLAERQIVENYLSAKYGVPLAAGDVYAGDNPGNGNYDLDVFGIGRVNGTNLVMQAGCAGLGIQAANGTLDDGEWILAGHKVPLNSLVGTSWDRAWYVDETGTMDANFVFDFSDAGLTAPSNLDARLFYSPTDPYSFTMLGLSPTIEGDRLTFAVPESLLRDGYYTLGLVPEPATLTLLALGGLGLLRRRRRHA